MARVVLFFWDWAGRGLLAIVGCALAGCEEEHPTRLGLDLATAEARLDSAIALFECSYSSRYDGPPGRGHCAVGGERKRLSAISAIYVAAALAHLGEFLGEASIDGSELPGPTRLLSLAED